MKIAGGISLLFSSLSGCSVKSGSLGFFFSYGCLLPFHPVIHLPRDFQNPSRCNLSLSGHSLTLKVVYYIYQFLFILKEFFMQLLHRSYRWREALWGFLQRLFRRGLVNCCLERLLEPCVGTFHSPKSQTLVHHVLVICFCTS